MHTPVLEVVESVLCQRQAFCSQDKDIGNETVKTSKVLFIIPPHTTFEDFVNPPKNVRAAHKGGRLLGSLLTEMPLGALSMSAFLKRHVAVETKLIDFNIELNLSSCFTCSSFKEYFTQQLSLPKWQEFNPDMVCISVLFSTSYQNAIEIGEIAHGLFPGALILAGGGVPANLRNSMFEDCKSLDAVCYGEGEKPLLALVKAGKSVREELESHPSWMTKAKLQNVTSFQYDFIENLDEIPFYDYGLCDINAYNFNPAISAYAGVTEKNASFHVMTSRGCVHRCCFCASHTVHGRKMRYFSIERVKADFRNLRDNYGARTLIFQDDHLLASRERFLDIISLLKELGLKAVFQNGLALYALDRPMLEAMREVGVEHLMLSVESGSERVLKDIMHKPLNLSTIRRVAADCRDLGIYTNVNVMIGLPGETKEDIESARGFLKTLDANWYMVFCTTPLIGSEMFNIALEKGFLKHGYVCDYKKAALDTDQFDSAYIQEKAYLLNLELNFLCNSDLRLKNYAVALKGFQNAIKAKPDHAFAHYFAAKCYEGLNNRDEAGKHLSLAREYFTILAWRDYAEKLGFKFD